MLAQVFLLAWPYGYPQLYSGYKYTDREASPPLDSNLRTMPILDDQGNCRAPWTCEHRHKSVAAMVDFRNQTNGSFSVQNWWSNGRDVISFSRGRQGYVMINFSYEQFNGELSTSLPDGSYCNIFDRSYNIQSRSCTDGYDVTNGKVRINIGAQSAVVLLRKSQVLQKSLKNEKNKLHSRL
ncbi:Alpha-amylase precursor [compost metagenome]